MNDFPLVEIAMNYVTSGKQSYSESVLAEIRREFFLLASGKGDRDKLAYLLCTSTGSLEPLEKIEQILNVPDSPIEPPDESYLATLSRKRTRTWTRYEDQRLILGVHKFGTNNWHEVAKFVGNARTRSQVAQRWCRGLDPRISKDSWTPSEEKKLLHIIDTHGKKGWNFVAQQMGNRSDVQCRYHYIQLVNEVGTQSAQQKPQIASYSSASALPTLPLNQNRFSQPNMFFGNVYNPIQPQQMNATQSLYPMTPSITSQTNSSAQFSQQTNKNSPPKKRGRPPKLRATKSGVNFTTPFPQMFNLINPMPISPPINPTDTNVNQFIHNNMSTDEEIPQQQTEIPLYEYQTDHIESQIVQPTIKEEKISTHSSITHLTSPNPVFESGDFEYIEW